MQKKTLELITEFIQIEGRANKSKRARKADRLIDQLYSELLRIFKTDVPVNQMKYQHGNEIHEKILAFAQKAWMLGVSYVSNQTGKNIVLTPQMMVKIQEYAEELEQRFWKLLSQRQAKIMTEFTDPQITNFLTFQASNLIVRLLNLSTVVTMRSIYGDSLSPDVSFVWETEQDDAVCPICYPLQGRIFRQSDEIPQPVDDTHIGCRCMLAVIDNSSKQAI